jgi:hypothetical protein
LQERLFSPSASVSVVCELASRVVYDEKTHGIMMMNQSAKSQVFFIIAVIVIELLFYHFSESLFA